MEQKISSSLNEIILRVISQLEDNYKDDSRYKIIMTGLKSASKALIEITHDEIDDFKIDN